MPYNSYFPMSYQPYQYQPQSAVTYQPQTQQLQQAPTPQASSNGIIWVQGEAGAKAYPVAAGASVLLMDSENECFYIKSTDISGMPLPLRTFNYSEIVASQRPEPSVAHQIDTSLYVTHEELEERLNALKQKQTTKTVVKKDKTDGE